MALWLLTADPMKVRLDSWVHSLAVQAASPYVRAEGIKMRISNYFTTTLTSDIAVALRSSRNEIHSLWRMDIRNNGQN